MMNHKIETDRRWLRSVIAASEAPLPKLAWMRLRNDSAAGSAARTAGKCSQRATPRSVPSVFGRPTAVAAR